MTATSAASAASKGQIAALQAAREANRQLMTSLSHDVRTPLTTLLGYLDAVHRGLVTGAEREIQALRRQDGSGGFIGQRGCR